MRCVQQSCRRDTSRLQHVGIRHHIMCKGRRLCALQMGVARHNRIKILAALCGQCLHEAKDQLDDLLDLLLDVQTHIECNLIVSRTAGVQTLAGITDALGQQLLDVHVDVLVIERELNLAVLDILRECPSRPSTIFSASCSSMIPCLPNMVACAIEPVISSLYKRAVKQDGRVKVVYHQIGFLLETSCP